MSRPPTEDRPPAPTLRLTWSGVLGSLAAIAVALVCIRLGIWQLHRLHERRRVNAAVEARMDEPPVTLGRIPTDTTGLLFRRIRVSGPVDASHSLVIAGRSFEGAPGVHLVTPIRIGGGAILVNRGWLPSPDASTVDLLPYDTAVAMAVVGLALPFDPRDDGADYSGPPDSAGFRRVWYGYEAAMRGQIPYPTATFYLQALPDAPPDPRTVGPASLPARLPPPALSEGPHLSYAIQWFSFATITLIGWVLLARRSSAFELRDPRRPPGSSTPHGPV